MPRYQFTHEDAVKGGKKRAQMADFSRHCEWAYAMLQAKRPDCWRWIYEHRVKKYMQDKQQTTR